MCNKLITLASVLCVLVTVCLSEDAVSDTQQKHVVPAAAGAEAVPESDAAVKDEPSVSAAAHDQPQSEHQQKVVEAAPADQLPVEAGGAVVQDMYQRS